MLVSVIIPNWNGKNLLKACLSSLKKQSFKSVEIILVDNGSSDGSVEFVRKIYPNVRIIVLPENRGFAEAVNLGIASAVGKYIFLLNNDTEVERNCIKYLVDSIRKNPHISMVAAKILNFYKRDLIDNCGDDVDVVGHSFTRGTGRKDAQQYSIAQQTFLVTGGGSLFDKKIFKKVGLFDRDYFMYMEDVDLCFRAQLAGFKGWFEPRSKIYHIRMATSSKNKPLTEEICFRNMTMTIIKNFPAALILNRFNWLKIIMVHLNTILYLTSRGYFKGALRTEWYLLTHLPKILRKRQQVQKLKRVSDQYIISQVLPKKLTFYGLLPRGW